MRKIWAIFHGNTLIRTYWTQQEAESSRDFGQHVRRWHDGNYYNESGKPVHGAWTKV